MCDPSLDAYRYNEKVSTLSAFGFSHVFGESLSLGASLDFWKTHGAAERFSFSAPICPEKPLCGKQNLAKAVELHFLELPYETKVGIEFLSHSSEVHASCHPHPQAALSLAVRKAPEEVFCDPDGNRVLTHPKLKAPITVIARVWSPESALEFLKGVGFQEEELAGAEKDLLQEVMATTSTTLSYRHPLFPARELRLILTKDPLRERHPAVNTLGWTGLSLIVADLDRMSDIFSLCGYQRIQSKSLDIEVAFHNESSLLVEFLKIHRV